MIWPSEVPTLEYDYELEEFLISCVQRGGILHLAEHEPEAMYGFDFDRFADYGPAPTWLYESEEARRERLRQEKILAARQAALDKRRRAKEREDRRRWLLEKQEASKRIEQIEKDVAQRRSAAVAAAERDRIKRLCEQRAASAQARDRANRERWEAWWAERQRDWEMVHGVPMQGTLDDYLRTTKGA